MSENHGDSEKWPDPPSLQPKIPFGKYVALEPKDLEQLLDMYGGEAYRVNDCEYWSVLKGMKLVSFADDNYPTALVFTFLPLDHCDRKDQKEVPDKVSMNEEYTACLHFITCRFPKDQRDQCRTRILNNQGQDVWPGIKEGLMKVFRLKQEKKVTAIYQAVAAAVSSCIQGFDQPTLPMEESKTE